MGLKEILEIEHPKGTVLHYLVENWRKVMATASQYRQEISHQEQQLEETRFQYSKCLGAKEIIEAMLLEQVGEPRNQEPEGELEEEEPPLPPEIPTIHRRPQKR